MNLEPVLKYSQIYNFWKWAARRNQPEEGRIFLSQRRVYILPTRNGLVFAVALMLMLIGSINYNLSLGYVLTFLLAGMGVVSILHTFRNLAYLTISAGRVDPVFAGEVVYFGLNFDNARDEPRRAIGVLCDEQSVSTGVPAGRTATVRIPVRAQRRGWLPLPRVTLETRYPLGLFRAWSYVQPAMRTLVYPRPDLSSLPAPLPKDDVGDALSAGMGSDDFAGLRIAQQGDSPRHIAWKAVATHDLLLTKTFMGRASRELVFDWSDLPEQLGTEARLSRLARYVLLAHEAGLSYGLRIPGRDISIEASEEQFGRCLEALALYDDRRK
jgi:uncharacterized protein (DUF58 family)